mgnify:FL=1
MENCSIACRAASQDRFQEFVGVAGIVKDSASGRNGYRGPYQLKPASHGIYPILFFAFGGDKGIKEDF